MFSLLHKNQKGAAAVEFAIVLPVLAAILFGTIDFALMFYNKQVLTNASRELARYAIIADNWEKDPDLNSQKEYIQNFCSAKLINLGGINDLINEPDVDEISNPDYVTATITYEYNHLFSAIKYLGFENTELVSSTVMRREH